MGEQSHYAKIMHALEVAKIAGVGCTLTNFDVIELLGYIRSLEEAYALEGNDYRSEIIRLKEDNEKWRQLLKTQTSIFRDLTNKIEKLKEDAERLVSTYVIEVFPHEWVCRGGCHHWARFGEQIDHAPDCPVTLHRQLMKEVE